MDLNIIVDELQLFRQTDELLHSYICVDCTESFSLSNYDLVDCTESLGDGNSELSAGSRLTAETLNKLIQLQKDASR